MKTVFNFLRVGYGVPDISLWNTERRESFNKLHIPLSDGAIVRVDGKREQKLCVGKAYILPSHVEVLIGGDRGVKSYEHLFVDFYVSPIAVNKNVVEIDLANDCIVRDFKEMLERRMLEYDDGRYIQFENSKIEPYMAHFLRAFLTYIFGSYKINTVQNEKLAKALEYIYEHYNESISNEDIAKSIYVHPRQLMRLFREELNMTPHRCLTEYRINMAVNMLEDGMQIKEIYLNCGFEDRNTFRRAFKKLKFIPPSEYYEAVKNKSND